MNFLRRAIPIMMPLGRPRSDRDIFDLQTRQFCELCRQHRELNPKQFVFYVGTLAERAAILRQAEELAQAGDRR